jgi:hypothetical protein
MIQLLPNHRHTGARCGSRVRFHKGQSWLKPHLFVTSPAQGAALGAAPRCFPHEQRPRTFPMQWRELRPWLDRIIRVILAAFVFPVLLIVIATSIARILVVAFDSLVRGRVKLESTFQSERVGLKTFRS